MKTREQSNCCREDARVLNKLEEMELAGTKCITSTERFRVLVLDPDVLELTL
jgi:hypothetical protein